MGWMCACGGWWRRCCEDNGYYQLIERRINTSSVRRLLSLTACELDAKAHTAKPSVWESEDEFPSINLVPIMETFMLAFKLFSPAVKILPWHILARSQDERSALLRLGTVSQLAGVDGRPCVVHD
ncbi:hypothetical protein EDC26_104196 [Paralcaligenes ureilyticus]|uniref:Uncharacterized protein n=1 Tax=Paralcaligenes ureilyticus TaxID=627131 RepID=A0A4R3M7K8_9BURK|nr:hypothetical protein EDC26_104196 [Paralcaligenes ureilyticus]